MDIKTIYWTKVRNLTWIFLFLWLFIAVFLPVIAPLFKGVRIIGLPSLHMYINAFIVIVMGVVLIFIYAAIMNKFDAELKSKVKEEELE
ncbi:MAG: DUF4212 domain-containing protein [Thermodesulfovibrionales bacterium]|nr:DUF4212 domain-containing protein [Thermodesulfovibrionales bacterium]